MSNMQAKTMNDSVQFEKNLINKQISPERASLARKFFEIIRNKEMLKGQKTRTIYAVCVFVADELSLGKRPTFVNIAKIFSVCPSTVSSAYRRVFNLIEDFDKTIAEPARWQEVNSEITDFVIRLCKKSSKVFDNGI